jgi:hypothetical protein
LIPFLNKRDALKAGNGARKSDQAISGHRGSYFTPLARSDQGVLFSECNFKKDWH